MAKKSKSAKKPAKEFKPRFESTATLPPRLPKAVTEARVVETMPTPTLYLCIAENSVCVKSLEFGRRFGRGQIVDLSEKMKDGSELRTHVVMKCFAPMRAGGE